VKRYKPVRLQKGSQKIRAENLERFKAKVLHDEFWRKHNRLREVGFHCMEGDLLERLVLAAREGVSNSRPS